MKKTALVFFVAITIVLVLTSVTYKIQNVKGADEDYIIEYVDHKIVVLSNGYVFMNDTVHILGNAPPDAGLLDHFLIGLPYKYGLELVYCIAYDESGMFNVVLNVPLEDKMGFYFVKVIFPQPLNISSGVAHVFTVGFMISNSFFTSTESYHYTLNYPAYPSLTKTAESCRVSLVLGNFSNLVVSKDDGTVTTSSYTKDDLPSFVYSLANATFTIEAAKMQLFDVDELKRVIAITGTGDLECSDSYYITSNEPEGRMLSTIEIVLPLNCSSLTAQDQFGRKMSAPSLVDEQTGHYRVTFTLPIESYRSASFVVKYSLLNKAYIEAKEDAKSFDVTFPLFKYTNYYVKQASIAFVLPEGAILLNTENALTGRANSLARTVFQYTLTVGKQDVGYLEDAFPTENVLQFTYGYNPLWLSFRPTIIMWALMTVVCAVFVAWRRPAAPATIAVPTVAMRIRPDYIKSFAESYEEKMKIIADMDSLEKMVQKGRIPRRRYKVRRKILETRLDTLSRSLTESKEKMRGVGGKYTDLMRQLEVAETEITEGEANIKSIDSRLARGEISLEAHRKLVNDYQRRKDSAEMAITGILLRLREEIR